MADEKKDTQVENPDEVTKDNGIVVETVEDDMRSLGVLEDTPDANKVIDSKMQEKNPDEEFKPKKKSRAQRRIESQQRTIKELRAKLETQTQPRKQPTENSADSKANEVEPDIDDFDSYEDYLEALDKYENGTTPKTEETTKAEQPKPKPDGNANDRVVEVLNEGKQEFADFEKVVMDEKLPLSQELLNEVVESDYAPEILYNIAKSPKTSEELSLLSKTDPERLKREIVKMEVKLEEEENGNINKTDKKITKAPEPINPVEGTSALSKSADDEGLSFSEYEELMKKKQQQERGGFL